MNYKYNEELGIFEVEEEVVVELEDVKTWFEALEDIADELEREDICLPFDEVIREDEEFLEDIIVKTNKRCNITNKYVSIIALKEFMGIKYPKNSKINNGDNMKWTLVELEKLGFEKSDLYVC